MVVLYVYTLHKSVGWYLLDLLLLLLLILYICVIMHYFPISCSALTSDSFSQNLSAPWPSILSALWFVHTDRNKIVLFHALYLDSKGLQNLRKIITNIIRKFYIKRIAWNPITFSWIYNLLNISAKLNGIGYEKTLWRITDLFIIIRWTFINK